MQIPIPLLVLHAVSCYLPMLSILLLTVQTFSVSDSVVVKTLPCTHKYLYESAGRKHAYTEKSCAFLCFYVSQQQPRPCDVLLLAPPPLCLILLLDVKVNYLKHTYSVYEGPWSRSNNIPLVSTETCGYMLLAPEMALCHTAGLAHADTHTHKHTPTRCTLYPPTNAAFTCSNANT